MAKVKKSETVEEMAREAAPPQLTLRAGEPGHMKALIAVNAVLGGLDELVRAFELFEEK